jgi:dihydroorotase
MKLLIKNAFIVSPSSPFNGFKKDILIIDGIIKLIENSIDAAVDTIIEKENLHVSIGWVDVFTNFCDPGFEHRENLLSGSQAAAAGGFTDVMVLPNTKPVIDNKSQVEYITQKANSLVCNIYPIGAVTKNAEGIALAEMYDMQQSGAIAFSDGIHSIQSTGILLKALQYIKSFDGTIIQIPEDKSIGTHGLMNEGIVATQLGLPGKPAIAEEIMIARDIKLAKYADSKLHFTGVSTAKSLEYIKRAKDGGLKITCSVTPYHFYFNDENLTSYDTNFKVNPPLRNKADQLAIKNAIIDGTVDCIASHHLPQHSDDKICEFEYAKNGMIGLQSLFGVLGTIEMPLTDKINMLSLHPRQIFSLPIPEIKIEFIACLTLFVPDVDCTFLATNIKSIAKNSAFVNMPLKGIVIGIVNGDKVVIN